MERMKDERGKGPCITGINGADRPIEGTPIRAARVGQLNIERVHAAPSMREIDSPAHSVTVGLPTERIGQPWQSETVYKSESLAIAEQSSKYQSVGLISKHWTSPALNAVTSLGSLMSKSAALSPATIRLLMRLTVQSEKLFGVAKTSLSAENDALAASMLAEKIVMFSTVAIIVAPMRWDCGRDHADFLARLFAASSANRSVEAQPLAANVAHWSLGILSRNIQERTVCGETEHTEATVSSSPALLTIDA
jgi:hypothetical protein